MANGDTPVTPTPDVAAQQTPPDIQGPQTNPDQPLAQTGDTQTPAPPATAPASTLPPSKTSGVHGVLAHIALGALAGAVTGIKKTAQNLPYVHAVRQEDKLNQVRLQAEQQDVEAKKQEMQQKQTASMDAHQIHQLQIQDMNMDHLHKIAENAHLEKMYPGLEEEQRTTLLNAHREQDTADRAFLTHLEEIGVHITPKTFGEFTSGDADNIGKGDQTVISNGKTGADAGGGFVSNQELMNTILPHDISVVKDWNMDKDGNITPIYQTLKAGQNSAMDALIAHDAGMEKFNQLQDMRQKQLTAQKEQQAAKLAGAQAGEAQAAAEEKRSAAALNDAYVKQLGGGEGGGTPLPAVADALSKLPPQVQKDLQSFSPAIQGLLIRGAYGWIDPNTFPQRLTKGGIGITRAQATGIMNEINPNYGDQLYNNIKKAQADFAGNTAEGRSIRSFNQFLVHAQELKRVSDNFARTQSPWINQPLNTIRAKGMGDPGVPEMMTAVEAARQEWTTFINSGYKPDEDTQKRADILMSDKSTMGMIMGVLGVMGTQAVGRLDQLNESYKTLTGQDYPNLITPSGRQAARELGINTDQYQSGGSFSGGAGQTGGNTVPAGAQPVIINGKTIGYSTDGKTMTRFK